jgi:hypothetical protein
MEILVDGKEQIVVRYKYIKKLFATDGKWSTTWEQKD